MELQDVKDIGAMIKILSEALRQQANRDCREYNLTMQQMRIIHFLKKRENNEVTSQKDIQDFLKISHPTVVNILHLMKNKGLTMKWILLKGLVRQKCFCLVEN